MINPAWAQAASGGPQSLLQTPFVPVILVMAVFYFLVYRPQQLKAKEQRLMLANLKRNDDVITSGGIYGKIVALADKVVTLEIAPNVRIRVDRDQIGSLVGATGKASAAAEDGAKDKEKDKAK